MKVTSYSLAAGTVAFSATVLAFPALYRRAVEASTIIRCFGGAVSTGTWPADCAATFAPNCGIIQGISVADLIIDFFKGGSNSLSLSSSKLSGGLLPVPKFTWPELDAAQHATIVDAGIAIASFDTPSSPVTISDGGYSSVVQLSILTVLPGQDGGFGAFMASLITKSEHRFILRGNFDVVIKTNAPKFPSMPSIPESVRITNIGFESNITLKGCNSFQKIDYLKQVSLNLDSATGAFTLTSLINIENPSQLDLNLGDVTFQGTDKDTTSIIKNMRLKMGNNQYTLITTSSNKALYNNLTTVGATLTLGGSDNSSPNPFVNEGMKNVKAQLAIPKLNQTV